MKINSKLALKAIKLTAKQDAANMIKSKTLPWLLATNPKIKDYSQEEIENCLFGLYCNYYMRGYRLIRYDRKQ